MTRTRERTVAFSGHRSYKMKGDDPERAAERLRGVLSALIAEGYDTFLTGMAEGFDLMAAQEVLRLREQYPQVHLVGVVPFAGQAERFTAVAAAQYRAVLQAADRVETLGSNYDSGCYHRRNDFLLDHASCLVCLYNGSAGGTRYCWEQAARRGLRRINVSVGEDSQATLF